MNDHPTELDDFDGRARLFPLPNLVLFPHVMQPLHIFEPRYRQMTADALEGDRRIALVLPRPGWEKNYAGAPAIHDVACLGTIIADQKLEDGRYNLLVRGVARIRIEKELATDRLYRVARADVIADVPLSEDADEARIRRRLLELAPRLFPQPGKVKDEFRKLLMGPLPLGALADITAFALPLPPALKQELLEQTCVLKRLSRLIGHLESQPAAADDSDDHRFPPEFSVN